MKDDELSEVSDNSDLFHTAVDADKDWITEQDEDLGRIHHISTLLRDRPLFPADPRNPAVSWCDKIPGLALPRVHCPLSRLHCVMER